VDTLNGTPLPVDDQRVPTIAEGASIARPVRLSEAVDVIRRSGGAGVAVSDEEIRLATRTLALRGLYAEPTSAVAAAALTRFIADGTIQSGQTTAVVLTGSGFKSAQRMAEVFAS
jgi:threonine synthase